MCGAIHPAREAVLIIAQYKPGERELSLLNGILVYLMLQSLSLLILMCFFKLDGWM
jgi:hypothetical protein